MVTETPIAVNVFYCCFLELRSSLLGYLLLAVTVIH